jgi:transcription-repair coupling factor (superfamily II helicase)
VIVASSAALLPRVSGPERLLSASLEIRSGTEIDPQNLADLLVDAGFTREDPVEEHGSFAVRGGIVDIFLAGDAEPVRLEFVGDMVESLRRFDPSTQRSTGAIDQLLIVPVRERFDEETDSIPLFEFLSATRGLRVVVSEEQQVRDQAQKVRDQLESSFADATARGHVAALPPDQAYVTWTDLEPRLVAGRHLEELAIDESSVEPGSRTSDPGSRIPHPGSRHVRCQPALEFRGRVNDWIAELRQARERGDAILFVAESQGRAERTIEILQDYDIVAVPVERAEDAYAASVLVAVGSLSRGFRLSDAALQIYAETDVFEEERHAPEKRRNLAKTFLSDLRDLKVGDLVVHVDHGIGEFVGLKQLGVRGSAEGAHEFLELRYHGDDKLFVPVERLDLIQKYTGGTRPALDRLGGTTWEKAKTRVKKAMRDMAEELLKLYAQRKAVPGYAFSGDTHWQEEFEAAFPYELTPDQGGRDPRHQERHGGADADGSPALRRRRVWQDGSCNARRVQGGDGRQAGRRACADDSPRVSAPEDPARSIRRFSRLRSRWSAGFAHDRKSRPFSKASQSGKVDIIVGTHRLLSKDVVFKDLGLLVVDEEQRFGVAHKERIKQMRKRIDVLTMTATADSADLEHVTRRHPRHVDHRNAAKGSALDPDQRREIRRACDRACRAQRTRARRTDLFRAQPGRIDFLDRTPAAAAGPRSTARCGSWTDG